MLTTDEVKRMGKIMLDGSRKTLEKVDHVIRQLQFLPDAIRADFTAVKIYLVEIVENEGRICSKEIAKGIEKNFPEMKAVRISYGKNKGQYVVMSRKHLIDARYDVFNSDVESN